MHQFNLQFTDKLVQVTSKSHPAFVLKALRKIGKSHIEIPFPSAVLEQEPLLYLSLPDYLDSRNYNELQTLET